MSNSPLAPRHGNITGKPWQRLFTDSARILLLTTQARLPHLTRGAAGVSLLSLPCRRFWSAKTMLCAPPGEESTCYAVYSVVKVLAQRKSVNLVYAAD